MLLYDEQSKHNFWKTCKIDQLFVGIDGHVCEAQVKVPTKSGKTILKSILKHLIPLDVKTSEARTEPDSFKRSSKSFDQEQSACSRRPQQIAAIIGELRRTFTTARKSGNILPLFVLW